MAALTDEQREKIVAAARSYLGTPWRGQGRDHLGIDCVGLGERAYIEAGIPLPETPATYRGVHSVLLMKVMRRYWRQVGTPKPGDLVIYRVLAEGHMAVLVPSGVKEWPLNGIHCPINGKVVEAIFDSRRGDIQGYWTWQ